MSSKSAHKGLSHHIRQPHGLLIIGGFIFFAAWLFWTFFLATPLPASP